MTTEELCKSLTINNDSILVLIHSIKSEYKKHNSSEINLREQKIIIIGHKNILKYFNSSNAKMYGIDNTFKIIPKSYTPYKLMTIYAIEKNLKKVL